MKTTSYTKRDDIRIALGLRYPVIAYRSERLARHAAITSIVAMRVVLGDCDEAGGEFWVVCPADAAKLEQAGYEMAPR